MPSSAAPRRPFVAEVLGDARILRFVDLGAVAGIYPEYGSGEGLEIAAEAISLYMQECAGAGTTWLEVVDEFEGVEQVPLMTVHKSKGLEYDTILFVGLDGKMWWSHKVGGYGRASGCAAGSVSTVCSAAGVARSSGRSQP